MTRYVLSSRAEPLAYEHWDCQRENPGDHNCSCHIAPPCSACVGCPSFDENAWLEVPERWTHSTS